MTRTKSSRALVSVVLAVLMAVAFMPAISYTSFAATAKKATKVTKVYHKANTTYTRTVGAAWTLKYKLSPSKLTSAAKKVVWKSSNKSVVSVSAKSGNKAAVSFKKAGTATVTVYTKANKKAKATWKFKVVNAAKKVAATGVTVKANNSSKDYTTELNVGTVLTATVAPANATGVTYQWYADGTAIDGATDSQFTVTPAQIGKKITVKAKANTGDEVTSTESAAVAEVKIDNLKLSGTPKIGETLTVTGTSGNTTMSDAVLSSSVDVQWYRYKEAANGNKVDEAISGATGTTYKVADADAGYQLYAVVTPKTGVKVSNTITGYKDGKVTLTKTNKVAAASTSITGVKIQVNGKDLESNKTYDAGTVLTAVVDPVGAANAVDYQWYQNGYKISGATSATYTAATSGSYTVKITLKSTEMTYGFAKNAKTTSNAASVKASNSFSNVTLTNVTAANDSTRTDKTVTYAGDKLGVEVSGIETANYTVQWHKISKDNYGDPVDEAISSATNTTYTVNASDVAVGDQVYAVVTGKTGTQYADYSGKTSALTISQKASTTETTLKSVTVEQSTDKKTVTVKGLPTGDKVQLQKQTVSGIGVESAWSDISDATSTTYELTTDDLAAITAGTVKVRAKVTDANGNLVGYTAAITLK
jgi:hypothetical protein